MSAPTPHALGMKLRVWLLAATLTACGRDSTGPRFVESSLVAAGQVLGGGGTPAENAVVMVQTLSSGKAGGEFGCTGSYLTGNWAVLTGPDGRFTVGMRLQSDGAPVCIVVLALGAGDTAWRDTASVVRALTRAASGVPPDTVHFDLRVLSTAASATRGAGGEGAFRGARSTSGDPPPSPNADGRPARARAVRPSTPIVRKAATE